MTENPYKASSTEAPHSSLRMNLRRGIGTGVLVMGLLVLAYGAIALWIIPILPPNEPTTGRLNSLYVLGAGMIISLIGLAVRETRRSTRTVDGSPESGVKTSVGLLVLFVAAILFGVAFAVFG